MTAQIVTKNNVEFGKKYRVTGKNRPSDWATGILAREKHIEYVVATKVHSTSNTDVIYFEAFNKKNQKAKTIHSLLAIGYKGHFDLIDYIEEAKFSLDEILGNLDKLGEKFSK